MLQAVNNLKINGGEMASVYNKNVRKKPAGKMIFMGILSVASYAVLLIKQDAINSYFGRGGIYALLPVATAFIFSFIHGSFTGNFWTVLGVEAKKKKEVK
jgi:F0F1-type ATP synthase assembly protein I